MCVPCVVWVRMSWAAAKSQGPKKLPTTLDHPQSTDKFQNPPFDPNDSEASAPAMPAEYEEAEEPELGEAAAAEAAAAAGAAKKKKKKRKKKATGAAAAAAASSDSAEEDESDEEESGGTGKRAEASDLDASASKLGPFAPIMRECVRKGHSRQVVEEVLAAMFEKGYDYDNEELVLELVKWAAVHGTQTIENGYRSTFIASPTPLAQPQQPQPAAKVEVAPAPAAAVSALAENGWQQPSQKKEKKQQQQEKAAAAKALRRV